MDELYRETICRLVKKDFLLRLSHDQKEERGKDYKAEG
jgi:hypothetical protein